MSIEQACSTDPFKPYRVSHWSGCPHEETARCLWTKDFPSAWQAASEFSVDTTDFHVHYVVLEGPNLWRSRKNPFYSLALVACELLRDARNYTRNHPGFTKDQFEEAFNHDPWFTWG